MIGAFLLSLLYLLPIPIVAGGLALYLVRERRRVLYVWIILGIYIAGSAFLATLDSYRYLGFFGELLLSLLAMAPFAAAYAFVTGFLVGLGSNRTTIVLTTVGIHVVVAPITVILGLYLICYIAGDCL